MSGVHFRQEDASRAAVSQTSLPVQLVHHALHELLLGCPAECCLLPLDLCNDAAAYCGDCLHNPCMAHAAALQGSLTLNTLLDGVSAQVQHF